MDPEELELMLVEEIWAKFEIDIPVFNDCWFSEISS